MSGWEGPDFSRVFLLLPKKPRFSPYFLERWSVSRAVVSALPFLRLTRSRARRRNPSCIKPSGVILLGYPGAGAA
jgi:hypothetical protein